MQSIALHDAADAEAICEAVESPTMRFVPVKTAEQQATALLHRGREQLVRQRTMLVNALRAHLAEFGIVAAQGLRNVGELIAIVRDDGDTRLPDAARQGIRPTRAREGVTRKQHFAERLNLVEQDRSTLRERYRKVSRSRALLSRLGRSDGHPTV